jgi:uncharacterized CHY-type Zn-finger protein
MKSPEMEAYLHTLQPTRATAMANQQCVVCGCLAGWFKDDISAKEYTISGLCQSCQDEAFDEEEDQCNEQDWRADR